jgi:hypothetical protein
MLVKTKYNKKGFEKQKKDYVEKGDRDGLSRHEDDS